MAIKENIHKKPQSMDNNKKENLDRVIDELLKELGHKLKKERKIIQKKSTYDIEKNGHIASIVTTRLEGGGNSTMSTFLKYLKALDLDLALIDDKNNAQVILKL